MKKRSFLPLLFLLTAAAPMLRAQTDTLPPLGGLVLDAETFASLGEPASITRSSPAGSRKSLLGKVGITAFNQRCEAACGACAVTAAVMVRLKIYCDAQCKCSLPIRVFSWSYLHNQVVKLYGRDNIRLKYVLDLLQKQGIPLAEFFPNTPCSHERLPDENDRAQAARFSFWNYQPVFKAKIYIPGSSVEKEIRFREQMVPRTIAWIDRDIPVIIGLLVTEDFRLLTPQDCLWEVPDPLDGATGHALLVMGYDDSTAEFEVLNSYGTGWGCGGVARIGYADYARMVQEGYVLKFDFDTGKKVPCPGRR